MPLDCSIFGVGQLGVGHSVAFARRTRGFERSLEFLCIISSREFQLITGCQIASWISLYQNVLSTARHGQQAAIYMPLGISLRHRFLRTLMARWAGVESFPSRVSSTTLSFQLQGGEAGSKGMQWRPTSITPPKKQLFRRAFFLTFHVHQVTEICNRRYPNSAGKIVRPSHKPFANPFAAPLHALASSIEQHFSFMRPQGYSILSMGFWTTPTCLWNTSVSSPLRLPLPRAGCLPLHTPRQRPLRQRLLLRPSDICRSTGLRAEKSVCSFAGAWQESTGTPPGDIGLHSHLAFGRCFVTLRATTFVLALRSLGGRLCSTAQARL